MHNQEPCRPGAVFAHRLRELREARGVSQTTLADLLTTAGVPMNKWAVMRIETGQRQLTLDEALAIALVLKASFAHLLTPPDGGLTAVTEHVGLDGAALREWLRYGTPGATHREAEEELMDAELEERLAVLAVAYLDARANDKTGKLDALLAIDRLIQEHDLRRFREVRGVWIEAAPGTAKQGDKLTRRVRPKGSDRG